MSELSIRYATALVDLAKEENKLDEYYNYLNSFISFFNENDELNDFFASFKINTKTKQDFINKHFNNLYNENFLNFLYLILKNGRGNKIYLILKDSLKLFEDELNIERGVIYSSKKLNDNYLNRIVESFKKKLNKRVVLKNEIDPSLIGGIKIVLRNDIYDASIKNKLDNLKKMLIKGEN